MSGWRAVWANMHVRPRIFVSEGIRYLHVARFSVLPTHRLDSCLGRLAEATRRAGELETRLHESEQLTKALKSQIGEHEAEIATLSKELDTLAAEADREREDRVKDLRRKRSGVAAFIVKWSSMSRL